MLHCNWWQQRNHQLGLSTEQLQALWASSWGQTRLEQARALRAASGLFPSSKLSLALGFDSNSAADFRLANWDKQAGHIYANPEHLPFADASVHCVELVFFLNLHPQPPAVLAEAVRVLAKGGCLLCVNLLLLPQPLAALTASSAKASAPQRALVRASNLYPWQAYWLLTRAGLQITKYQRQQGSYMLQAEKRRFARRGIKLTAPVPAGG